MATFPDSEPYLSMSHSQYSLPPANTGPYFEYSSSGFSVPQPLNPRSSLFQVEGGYPTSIPPSSAGDITTPLDSLPTNHLHGASPQLDLCLAMPSPSSSFSLSPFPDTPPTDGLVDINAIYHEPLDGFRKAEVHNFLLSPSFPWYQPSPQNYSTQPQSHFLQSGYGPTTHPQNLSTQPGQPYLANATCELNHLQAALLPTQSGIESHITASGYAHNLSPTPEDFEKENTFGEAPYFPFTNFVQPGASVSTMPPLRPPFDAAEPVSPLRGPNGLSSVPDRTTRPSSIKNPYTQQSRGKAWTSKILCRWGNPTEHCGVRVLATSYAVRDHLREYHADVKERRRQNDGGKKDTKMKCLWVGCRRRETLDEENLGRHICQSVKAGHLLSPDSNSEGGTLRVLGSNCELCGRSFSRRDAMLRHLKANCNSLPR
ncbi:hypothetical protein K443DRAFT_13829 [Laccaria amethystina LaAM-08-1]|uniref:Unplaced genomic scaffold K443scaffold_399, whole genome shotgun sequence n=1 Tax=Laccaria amethystina LaAM-08-1 TaxID=1095629 RepID=A0A0C9WI11_9AGAR|nr:hypothetical protein K443DRAFT_13829 [Laccaria amethystina LaAM-08-1]